MLKRQHCNAAWHITPKHSAVSVLYLWLHFTSLYVSSKIATTLHVELHVRICARNWKELLSWWRILNVWYLYSMLPIMPFILHIICGRSVGSTFQCKCFMPSSIQKKVDAKVKAFSTIMYYACCWLCQCNFNKAGVIERLHPPKLF